METFKLKKEIFQKTRSQYDGLIFWRDAEEDFVLIKAATSRAFVKTLMLKLGATIQEEKK